MFNLIRRISYGVIPRPDRPWEEDATSNAPNTRRKRRLSSVERDADADDDDPASKKWRADGDNLSSSSPAVEQDPARAETPAVKEVTRGVKRVDLSAGDADADADAEGDADEEGEEGGSVQATMAPETVPLPDEKAGELDELEPTTPNNDDNDEPSTSTSASPSSSAAPVGPRKNSEETKDASEDTSDDAPTATGSAPLNRQDANTSDANGKTVDVEASIPKLDFNDITTVPSEVGKEGGR